MKASEVRAMNEKELQEKLNSIGYDCGEVDGIFGKKTEAGVRSFQRAMNITIDGIFGKNSYKCLHFLQSLFLTPPEDKVIIFPLDQILFLPHF